MPGVEDMIVAQKSWKGHMERNQSIIVDSLTGLFKSTIVCPECKYISITFDPFLQVSLPVPQDKSEALKLFAIDYEKGIFQMTVNISPKDKVSDIEMLVCQQMKWKYAESYYMDQLDLIDKINRDQKASVLTAKYTIFIYEIIEPEPQQQLI